MFRIFPFFEDLAAFSVGVVVWERFEGYREILVVFLMLRHLIVFI